MNPIEEINKALDELENMEARDFYNKRIKEEPTIGSVQLMEEYAKHIIEINGHGNDFIADVSQCNFTFTISDGYCTYSYPLNIGSNNSVDDVAKKIYKAFNLKKENGTLVKP